MRSLNACFLSTNHIHDFIPLDAKDDKHFSILPFYLESTQMGQRGPVAPGMTLRVLTPTCLCKENQSKFPYFLCYSPEVQVGPIKENSDLPTVPELRCYKKYRLLSLLAAVNK